MKNKLPNINSNTGYFVDGNPSAGILGTVVTAEWLNNVQDRLQNIQDELLKVLDIANVKADPTKINQVAEAIKIYCDNLKQDINNHHIPNAKKSSDVNSSSVDTVATSLAVKTANDNANNRVAKTGDTMTGPLIVPYLKATGEYISVSARGETFAGFDVIRQGHPTGNWLSRLEALPDKRWKFWVENSHEIFLPNRGGTVALEHETVPKNGDSVINGRLFFHNAESWIGIRSNNSSQAGLDFTVWGGQAPQNSIMAKDSGGYATEFQIFTTPPGHNYSFDRRHHAATIGWNGDIWTRRYGWLTDFFIQRGDFVRTWYPNHYGGTEVYKIRHLQLMITVMNINQANGDYFLPEAYDGHACLIAQDRGYGGVNLDGSHFVGGNRIHLKGRNDTHCHVIVIGYKDV